jgi:hypothetical protein
MWVLTVFGETYSSPAMSEIDSNAQHPGSRSCPRLEVQVFPGPPRSAACLPAKRRACFDHGGSVRVGR